MKIRLKKKMWKKIAADSKGASAVEFAMILPVLVVILFGIIEFGIILYNKAVITNASREGARYGIVYRPPGEEISCPAITNIISERLGCDDGALTNCANLITFGASSDLETPDYVPAGCNPDHGEDLTVNLSYQYEYLLLPSFVTDLTGTLTLSGRTVMVKE